jgi:four helix bundle protein
MASHHDLKVWQRSQELAAQIHEATRGKPGASAPELVAQIRRSSQSIGANIAEGRGLRTNPQFKRHLDIALGSAAETDSHLTVCLDQDLLSAKVVLDLRDKLAMIQRMLVALKASLPEK